MLDCKGPFSIGLGIWLLAADGDFFCSVQLSKRMTAWGFQRIKGCRSRGAIPEEVVVENGRLFDQNRGLPPLENDMQAFVSCLLNYFCFVGFCFFCTCCSVTAQDLMVSGGHRFDTETGKMVNNKNIVIRAGRILGLDLDVDEKLFPQIKLENDQYVLPGLVDLHAHYNVRLFRKRREEYLVMPIVYLANGATVTFTAGEYDPESMQELRLDIEAGKKKGPKLLNSGPYFGRARPGWGRNKDKNEIVAEVKKWAPLVGGFKAKSIRPDDLEILIEEAHKHGKTVTGHLDSGFRSSVNPRDAIEMGIDRIEHFLGGDALPADKSAYSSLQDVEPDMPEILKVIRLYVEQGTWFDATITAYGYFGERGEEYTPWQDEKSFFTEYVREKLKNKKRTKIETFEKIYQVKQKTIKAFYDAGGKITLGTDHFSDGSYLPGFGIHRELDAFVRSGIQPVDAIRIGTINGAKAMGIDKDHGSIVPGKFGDLYVIKGNPLKQIRNTRNGLWVVKQGVQYSCQELMKSARGKLGPNNDEEAKDW